MILWVLSVLLVVESDCQTPPGYAGVEWPSSKYGLPKPKSGCPSSTESVWHEGWRYQDMEDEGKPSSRRSRVSNGITSHMDVDLVGSKRDVKRHFCMKQNTGAQTRLWPKGSYCIYKSKGVACPKDMSAGWVRWDDEDYKNRNDFGGSLPDGLYDSNTIIQYCCQNQGNWHGSIELPVVRPFYLLTSSLTNTPVCQMVKWAFSYLEYIVFDTNDQNNGDRQGGSHVLIKPQDGKQIYYCYYEDCRRKMTDPSGSFRSHETTDREMDPRSQYCSWLITIAQTYIVSLSFRYIRIPNCHDTFIRIHDGSNDTSPVLGTYCGANASTEVEILSSTNSLFIVANSGSYVTSLPKTFSFNAVYNAEHLTGCHHEFIGNTGYIKSPKFDVPSNYPRHSNCSWLVTVGDGFLVALNLSFLIDSANDVIEIYDGISENTSIITRYSFINGSGHDGTLVSSTNIVYIVLKYGKSSSYLTGFVLDYASQLKPTETQTTTTLTSISTINTEEPDKESPKQSKDTSTVYIIVPVVVGVVVVIILIAVVCFHRRRKRKAERSEELHGINPSYNWRKKSSKSDDDSVCYSNPSRPQEKVWLGGSKICKEGRNPIYQPADEQEPASLYASTDATYEPLVDTNAGAAQSDNPLYGVSDVGSPHVYAEPSSQQAGAALYDEPDVKV